MGKLNRSAIKSVVFCLSISLLFSGCKTNPTEVSPSSNETKEIDNSESSSYDTEQTDNTTSYEVTREVNYPYDLSVQIISSNDDGDSTILNYKKTTQVLIDTAEGDASIEAVTKVMEEMKAAGDQTWDYVIFTHPDSDHIKNAPRLFELFAKYDCKVEHIIDFGVELEEDQETIDEKRILTKYKDELKKLEGTDYYSPNGDLSLSRLTKDFVIDSRFKLTLLYNQKNDTGIDNDQSVCCLFTIGEQKLLFTGDLERAGEIALYKNHPQLLRNVTFFKAGHHGSDTSNTKEFIDWIRPAYVAITYNHKIREDSLSKSISSFLKYTDYIYPTVVNNEYDISNNLFGECIFRFNGKTVQTVSEFNQNRTIKQAGLDGTTNSWYWRLVNDEKISDEINTYFFDENITVHDDGGLEVKERAGNLAYFNCTLVKYGHYDILIDCGSVDFDSKAMIDKLRNYVVDGVIECVIVSHYHLSNYSQMIGESFSDNDSVFEQFEIEKIIDNDITMTNNYDTTGTAYAVYLSKILSISDHISLKGDDSAELSLCYGLKLNVYRGNNNKHQDNEDDYSLVTVIDFNGEQMVFVGDLTNYSWFNTEYGNNLKNVRLMRFPSSYVEYTKMSGLDSFLNKTSPDVIILGSPVNHWNNGQYFIRGNSIKNFITYLENSSRNRNLKIYSSGYVDNNVNKSVFGDIAFTLFRSERNINNTAYKYYVSCCINGGSGKTNSREVTDKLNTSYYAYVPDDLRDFPTLKSA